MSPILIIPRMFYDSFLLFGQALSTKAKYQNFMLKKHIGLFPFLLRRWERNDVLSEVRSGVLLSTLNVFHFLHSYSLFGIWNSPKRQKHCRFFFQMYKLKIAALNGLNTYNYPYP